MKTKSIITIILLIFSLSSFSQNFWDEIPFSSQIQGNAIESFTVTEEGKIIVGANKFGKIYISGDNGVNWQNVYTDSTLDIKFSNFDINSLGHIYACINKKYILVSKDEGLTWNKLNTNLPNTNINKIYCKGADTLFVSMNYGAGANLIYSYNSGLTWNSSNIDNIIGSGITGIAFAKNNDIYVGTGDPNSENYRARVYKSSDNAISWDTVWIGKQITQYDKEQHIQVININSKDDVYILLGEELFANNNRNVLVKRNDEETFSYYDNYTSGECMAVDKNNDMLYLGYSNSIHIYFPDATHKIIDDSLSNVLQRLQVGKNGYLYGWSSWYSGRLVKSKYSSNSILLADEKKDLKEPEIILYPNPANNNLIVNLADKQQKIKNYKINILNASGKSVFKREKTSNDNSININISNLSPGVYVLMLQNDKETYTTKFVKE